MNGTVWVLILRCPKYAISGDGLVMRLEKNDNTYPGKIIKTKTNPKGYKFVTLHSGGKRQTVNVHRLIAEAFIPNPHCLSDVNHIDGNKSNNSINNLEWLSHADNMRHGFVKGLIRGCSKNQNLTSASES